MDEAITFCSEAWVEAYAEVLSGQAGILDRPLLSGGLRMTVWVCG
jgi:hypothetical protein